jgi:hypothetical protein
VTTLPAIIAVIVDMKVVLIEKQTTRKEGAVMVMGRTIEEGAIAEITIAEAMVTPTADVAMIVTDAVIMMTEMKAERGYVLARVMAAVEAEARFIAKARVTLTLTVVPAVVVVGKATSGVMKVLRRARINCGRLE